jgi:hypothetical protein
MDVRFDRSASDQRFRARVDLIDASVSYGDQLTKRSGSPLVLSIEGRADDEAWAADVIDATILTTNIII